MSLLYRLLHSTFYCSAVCKHYFYNFRKTASLSEVVICECFWPNFATNSHHMSATAHAETSCFLHSGFFLKSPVCSIESQAVAEWLWSCCGREGPLLASSRPSPEHRLALPLHPRVTSPPNALSTAGWRDGRVTIHQMLLRALAELIFCLASIQSDFSSSLSKFKCVWKPLHWSSSAGSEQLLGFSPGSGLGEGFLALKRSLVDGGRFQRVWPPEELLLLFFLIQRGCTAVLSTVELSWRVSGQGNKHIFFS